MHRETGIEQVSETDSAGFSNEPEKGSITVEGPGSPLPVERQLSFLRAINDLFIDPASIGSERKHDASRACPAGSDHRDGFTWITRERLRQVSVPQASP